MYFYMYVNVFLPPPRFACRQHWEYVTFSADSVSVCSFWCKLPRVEFLRRQSIQAIEGWNDRAIERSTERSSDRAIERSNDRAIERAIERSSDRAIERPSDRAIERSSDRAIERPSDRSTERAMIDRATERPSERSSGRAIDGDRKSSSRNPFETLTSALCSIFQN